MVNSCKSIRRENCYLDLELFWGRSKKLRCETERANWLNKEIIQVKVSEFDYKQTKNLVNIEV